MASASPMYELMYIINPVLNEEQTGDIVKRVETYLKDNGASIDQTNVIGSQRLAYPIEKKRNGYYVTVNFTAPGEFIARLDRALRINDEIMRHLLLRYDAKMQRHYQAQKSGASAPAATAEA
ncbi:MAG TPA: 30S ribosomal protein S6 [Bacteroidetes bacterium]|nr:30S ribosomal protein S6 [Bacteroidota bacterium]HIL58414.1 30S ribosomal protein S6 [Rhodothermales bacterium]